MQLSNEQLILIEQIKYWGLFNPNWQENSNEVFAEAEGTWEQCDGQNPYAIDWLKVMEAQMLRYFDEPIPEIESLKDTLLHLPIDVLQPAIFEAQRMFEKKHPGFIEADLRYRLTTASLKTCWMQEDWFCV